MRLSKALGLALCLLTASAPSVHAQNLTDDQVNLVVQRLAEGATHSWELGTRAQALLELDAPSFSVLTSRASVPPPTSLNATTNSSLSDVFGIALRVVTDLDNATSTTPPGGRPLFAGEGSAADPASIGVAVLLANWTGLGGLDYAGAATGQVEYLLGPNVPKTPDGAISHRVSQVQLWSDFVYMVPPFLAYYGVTTNNRSMIEAAYTQVKLYRNYLLDSSAGGLWKHILLGETGNDEGHWSTGNGWAAAGMLRVLATMKNSPYASSFKHEIKDLGQWALDIQTAMYPHLQSNNLFRNYADSSNASNFDDAASTALVAATVYRLALLTGTHKFVPQAERVRQTLFSGSSPSAALARRQGPSSPPSPSSPLSSSESRSSSSETRSSSSSESRSASPSSTSAAPTPTSTVFASAQHFSADGWLTPVVNPDSYGSQGQDSPESEAFVLMLHSAWRDWDAAGSPGANGAARLAGGGVASVCVGVVVALVAGVW